MAVNSMQGSDQNFKKFGHKKPVMMCVYCGMEGHTIERCYKKHGHPPGFKISNKISPGPVAVNKAFADNNAAAEIVHTNAVATSDANGGTMSEAPIRAPFISHEQYNHLLTLLQNVPSHTAAGGSNDIVAGQATILHVDFDHTHAM